MMSVSESLRTPGQGATRASAVSWMSGQGYPRMIKIRQGWQGKIYLRSEVMMSVSESLRTEV